MFLVRFHTAGQDDAWRLYKTADRAISAAKYATERLGGPTAADVFKVDPADLTLLAAFGTVGPAIPQDPLF